MPGEQLAQHHRVLVGDRGAELRQHAGRQPQPGRDRIEVPGAGARAGPDQDLVRLAGRDDLIDQWVDGGAAAVDDALPADLDHGGIRQDPEVRCRLRRRQKLRIGQRSLHQQRFKLRRRIRHEKRPFSNAPGIASVGPRCSMSPPVSRKDRCSNCTANGKPGASQAATAGIDHREWHRRVRVATPGARPLGTGYL
ncbi:hypothetical protein ACVIHH_007533 [Bradyrhizobium sp. USDA 4518]|nr:hypothetical protein [Bradyrhizobium sp. USDA 4545]MCP1920931.1 hypothetical protein [Bradyrhizobium sp. USDA 4532]